MNRNTRPAKLTLTTIVISTITFLTSCASDQAPADGDATNTNSPSIVTQYVTETVVPDGPDPTPGTDSGDVGEAALPDNPEPDGDFDPLYVTLWGRHGGKLELLTGGIGAFGMNSGAMNGVAYDITWTGSGKTVTFILGEQTLDIGEAEQFHRVSTGSTLTGVISDDGTKMDVYTDHKGLIQLCRTDAYDQVCGA